MGAKQLALGRIPFGAVYLVEPSYTQLEKRRDLEQMKALHFNTVVVWPPVSRWDGNPPGQTAFKSIDEVLDICAELGLKVILELQGQNTSNQEAPELLGASSNKTHLNHPKYRAMTEVYLREIVTHFRGHPALLAYDIYNELGFHDKDPWTIKEFIQFLKVKYRDDIQALNRAWGTYFQDFKGIAKTEPNYNAQYDLWYSAVPQLDWLRFRPYNWTQRLDEWTKIIRSIDPDVCLLADVLGNDTLHNRSDNYYGATDWTVAQHVDVLGLSAWANMLGLRWEEIDAFRWAQFWRAALSAGGKKQVIISEMMTPNRSMFPTERSSMSDQLRLWSYQAIFHGIKGLIYWQYRPFRRGLQVAGRGLCDFEGNPNEQADQATEVANFVERFADKLADLHPDCAACAILHDHNAQDLYSTIHDGEFYLQAHAGMFHGFWRHGISPAYVIPADFTDGVPAWIRVLAVPCNVSVSAQTAHALVEFMERGGILLTEGRFGLVDEDGNLWSRVPGGLANRVGFSEKSTSAIFKGMLKIGLSELEFKEDYYQYLRLEPSVNVVLEMQNGDPALIECHVGAGRHLHLPFILSHKIREQEDAALVVFRQLISRLQSFVCPSVAIITKDSLVDVSILLNPQNKATIIGITNFEQFVTTVRLELSTLPVPIGGCIDCEFSLEENIVSITLAARQAVALLIH